MFEVNCISRSFILCLNKIKVDIKQAILLLCRYLMLTIFRISTVSRYETDITLQFEPAHCRCKNSSNSFSVFLYWIKEHTDVCVLNLRSLLTYEKVKEQPPNQMYKR